MGRTIPCDVAIVGGGLAGGLIALALRAKRPDLDVRIVEGGATLGGDHVWSFFGSDVDSADRWLVSPLVVHAWRGYDVAFPNLTRQIDATYYSLTSERFDAVVRAALPGQAVMTGRKVLAASATAVVLADGDRIEAKGVIDCRGPGDLSVLELGWQKFVGQELALAQPHGETGPRVMDATVAQIDGYRFVYCLPFAEDRMFVEDTYYSDTPGLDGTAIGGRIADYARSRGWQVEAVVRGEAGVLPITLGGDFEAYWRSTGANVAKAGMRAGLFQPATGYSLPDAVRLAIGLAGEADLSGAALARFTYGHARAAWRRGAFYRMLNAMMFRAGDPAERWRIIEPPKRSSSLFQSCLFVCASRGQSFVHAKLGFGADGEGTTDVALKRTWTWQTKERLQCKYHLTKRCCVQKISSSHLQTRITIRGTKHTFSAPSVGGCPRLGTPAVGSNALSVKQGRSDSKRGVLFAKLTYC